MTFLKSAQAGSKPVCITYTNLGSDVTAAKLLAALSFKPIEESEPFAFGRNTGLYTVCQIRNFSTQEDRCNSCCVCG